VTYFEDMKKARNTFKTSDDQAGNMWGWWFFTCVPFSHRDRLVFS